MCVAVDRDKCRSDYEEKLRTELEQVRLRTDVELDRLKTSTREMYERENRSLTIYSLLPRPTQPSIPPGMKTSTREMYERENRSLHSLLPYHLGQLSLLSLQGMKTSTREMYERENRSLYTLFYPIT